MEQLVDPDRKHRFRPRTLASARQLRRSDVPAEKQLWQRLRDRQLGGLKIRLQVPMGKYVADFYCAEHRLVIELDGASHDVRHEHDAERTRWMESQGLRVVRYLNEDVYSAIDDVLRAILRECGRDTSPSPLRERPGEVE